MAVDFVTVDEIWVVKVLTKVVKYSVQIFFAVFFLRSIPLSEHSEAVGSTASSGRFFQPSISMLYTRRLSVVQQFKYRVFSLLHCDIILEFNLLLCIVLLE